MGKVGRFASEEVLISLLVTKCFPCLLYGVEACPLLARNKSSFDFFVNTNIHEIIPYCMGLQSWLNNASYSLMFCRSIFNWTLGLLNFWKNLFLPLTLFVCYLSKEHYYNCITCVLFMVTTWKQVMTFVPRVLICLLKAHC